MPGWTNVWTMPIQNRVDMLATGVNTPIGIRVLGRNLDDVVRGSEEVARVVKRLPGAVDVVADPIRGKPYIEVRLDRERAARLGVSAGDVNERDRDGPGRQGRHDDRRGPRAAPGRRPLSAGPGARTKSRCGTSSVHGPRRMARAGLARSTTELAAAGPALRGRRGPGRRGPRDDQGRKRAPAQLRPAERPRPRRRRPGRRGTGGRRPRRPAARPACSSSGPASSSTSSAHGGR